MTHHILTMTTQSQPNNAPKLDMESITRAWRALMAYRGLSLQVFDSQAMSFQALTDADQALIADVPVRLSHAADAVEHNADIVELIAALSGISGTFNPDLIDQKTFEETVSDFPDIVDALLGIVRDWSSIGEKDRSQNYDPVIRAVEEAAADALSGDDHAEFSVLVPGASLGRFPWELAKRGYTVQGVESSYVQLFMSNFVLNGTANPEKPLHLYPFVHHTGMIQSMEEQMREMEFPDTNPRELEKSRLAMAAGEFLELYDEEDSWDCVATCFCIENSHSIISYVRRIAKILKSGGVWVNHGSLDFRYDDSMTDPSIEITLEEFDLVLARSGFKVHRRETLRCKPPFAVNGMLNEEYESTLTVALRV